MVRIDEKLGIALERRIMEGEAVTVFIVDDACAVRESLSSLLLAANCLSGALIRLAEALP